jgi:hypothetical protein
MLMSIKRQDDVLRMTFKASRMSLQSRKIQMQNDINKLLNKKFSKTINDSTSLRLLRVVN